MWKFKLHGFEPFPDTRLACMNFLTSADEAYHDGPGFVPIEIRDKELRFGPVEVRNLLPTTHEVGRLRLRPRALRFIEDDDVIVWGDRRADALISEMMDILDERLHPLADRAFPFSVADPCKFVAGERLLEHGNQRTVSREVHSPRFAQRPSACRNVQADERLPSTRYARYEHYGFLVVLARAFDDLLDTDRRQAQILGSSIVTSG